MKLKLKLSILFSVIALLLIFMISLYLKFVVINHLMTRIEETRNGYVQRDQHIAKEIQRRYPQTDMMNKYLKNTALSHHMILTIYTNNLKSIRTYNGSQGKAPIEEWYPIRDRKGQIVLFLNVQREINLRELAFSTIFTWTLPFLILLLGVLFVLFFLYLNRIITRPVQRLNQFIRNINLSGSPLSMGQDRNRQDELGELYTHVDELQQRLHQSKADQIAMISAMTHDVKTPLTSINGFIELMQTRGDLTDQAKAEYLQLISKKAQDITQLMETLSSYAKDELSLPSFSLSRINAKYFFDQIAEEYEAELAGLDMHLIKNNAFESNDLMLGDVVLLRRVFANMISNAVKYGGKSNLNIFLSGYTKKKNLYFVLEDDGVGVPKKDLPYLFQKFFTVDQSRQSKVGGTGLGLATVQSIIDKHGGIIDAFNSTRAGLGIRFSIPKIDSNDL